MELATDEDVVAGIHDVLLLRGTLFTFTTVSLAHPGLLDEDHFRSIKSQLDSELLCYA